MKANEGKYEISKEVLNINKCGLSLPQASPVLFFFFLQCLTAGGGEHWTPCSSALIEPELREKKNERATRDERKLMISDFKVLSHWLTFQVKLIDSKAGKIGIC